MKDRYGREFEILLADHARLAIIVWEDGSEQAIDLQPGNLAEILAGANPVTEDWEDGMGNSVCYEAALDLGGRYGGDFDLPPVYHTYRVVSDHVESWIGQPGREIVDMRPGDQPRETLVTIGAETPEECLKGIQGQISDGAWENHAVEAVYDENGERINWYLYGSPVTHQDLYEDADEDWED